MFPKQMPKEFQERYTQLFEEYAALNQEYTKHLTEAVPLYMSIPKYFEDLGFKPTYAEMRRMAELATRVSREYQKPVREGVTELGRLNCYYQGVLDKCLDLMTGEFK